MSVRWLRPWSVYKPSGCACVCRGGGVSVTDLASAAIRCALSEEDAEEGEAGRDTVMR